MNVPKKIDALLIDMDGTLVDTLPMLFQVYKNFMKKFSLSGSREEFDELNGPSLREVLTILQKRYRLEEDIQSLLKQYQQEVAMGYSKNLLMFPNAQRTISVAKSHGLKIGLVSSAEQSLVKAFISSQKIETLFDAIITPEGINKSKPAPDIYLRALQTFNLSPGNALAIEDSLNGIQSARQAEIFTLWITHHQSSNQMEETEDPFCLKVCDWNMIDHFLKRYYV